VVEVPDGRVLTFKRSDKTQFFRDDKEIKPAELKVGDRVTVEATEDQEGYMTAVKVSVDTNPPPEESATTAAPAEKATATAPGGRGEGNSPAAVDTGQHGTRAAQAQARHSSQTPGRRYRGGRRCRPRTQRFT